MRPCADSLDLAPNERFREIARILAVGVRRLRSRTVFPSGPGEDIAPENRVDSGRDSLELPAHPRLSVHGG
jgi:hypothetical protein